MKKFLSIVIVAILCFAQSTKAEEGMWIPLLLKKYNIEQMQMLGFKLTAEDIYSVNQECMKDAVVIFGGGCTGELISDEGLIITNHHCGYGQIQSHSTVQHDYLTNGFWAMNRGEELVNPGLKVTFLRRMEDVSKAVLSTVKENMSENERQKAIDTNIKIITDTYKDVPNDKVVVKPFFNGNQYFAFFYEEFTDVRLVGAPPSAIGKFGGDTDNWMWPRHTGDFLLFRVYANKDNEPSDYSPDNVPYKPKHHFPISLKGVKENDFTMVFGYPGSTAEYAPSYHLQMLVDDAYPKLIDVRTNKLKIMNKFQSQDPAVRIKYAAKNASVSNTWKRWKGEIRGLNKLNAIDKKQKQEIKFQNWADSQSKDEYKTILSDYKELYSKYGDYYLVYNYMIEMIYRNGMEQVSAYSYFKPLVDLYSNDTIDEQKAISLKSTIIKKLEAFYKDYDQSLDKEMTQMLLTMYHDNMNAEFVPETLTSQMKKYKGDQSKYVDFLFSKSILSDSTVAMQFVNNFSSKSIKKLQKNPDYILYNDFYKTYATKIVPEYKQLKMQLGLLGRTYMAGLIESNPTKVFYPDANFTLRVGYGKVKGYKASDAVDFRYYTTLEGIIEKDNPDIYDYRVPEKLKQLHDAKDYGRYEQDGTVPVCFLATNHTTGGNSGSPVVNANGELIGINFDRAWEGVMSDLMYNPDQCRNISLDVRYVLFLIDKFAGAGYLLDEMTLVE